MAVIPTSRSSFTSTIWNSPAKGVHATNAARFGGPNVAIKEGSVIQFADGTNLWNVLRVFDDGTLFLSTNSGGKRITRKIPPSSSSWTNLFIVDGRRLRGLGADVSAPEERRGGGPNRNVDPGNIVTLGLSDVKWSVVSVRRDGSLILQSFSGEKVLSMEVGPLSRLWNSIYLVNG